MLWCYNQAVLQYCGAIIRPCCTVVLQVVAWAMNNMEMHSNFTLSFRFKAQLPDQQAVQDQR